MKNKLLTLLIILNFNYISNAQILNGGFENWSAGLPVDWWGVVIPPYNLLTQTNDAHTGSYAVKLKVEDFSGAAFASPLATGDGVVTAHPLNFVPGSISLWYKLNAVAGDYLSLTALVYSGGTGAGVAIQQLPAAANYTQFSTSIMYGNIPATADSIAIILSVSNVAGSATVGSEAIIDDVSISVSSGLPEEASLQNKWSVLPNPADETATLIFESKTKGSANIQLVDATGKTVWQKSAKKLNAGIITFELDTRSLKPGMYFCIIDSNGNKSVKSIVINHNVTR